MTLRRRSAAVQVSNDILARIKRGEWFPGEKLPSIRQFAREYGVAPLTISKVIRELHEANVVTTIASKGVYLAEQEQPRHEADVDTSWQFDLFHSVPYRSFSFVVPRGTPVETINLATGTMSHDAISIENIRSSLRETARKYIEAPVYERSAQGELPLREWFAGNFEEIGVSTSADAVLIVSSTHQAFRIIANATTLPGDVALIESPSDPIVVGVLEQAGVKCIGMDVQPDGIDPDQVRNLIARYRPKLIVTCPSGQIPTGVTMSAEKRIALARIAATTQTLIIEYDNGYEIYFDSPPPRPIKHWDTNQSVAFVRDISRTATAGFRIAALTINGPILQRIVDYKRRDDLLTSTLAQSAFLDYVSSRDFRPNLQRLRDFYKPRRDAAVAALESEMPPDVGWHVPNVGFHIWITLPESMSARAVAEEAALLGVVVVPSHIFSLDENLDNALRITFSTSPPEDLYHGIRRLATAIKSSFSLHNLSFNRRTFEIV